MTKLEIIQGAKRDWPLQCWNQGAQTVPTDWAAGDTLSATLYPGQAQTPIFDVAVAWYTASGTQTGYGQAQVQATITAAQSQLLEAAGEYTLIVWRVPAAGGDPAAIWRGTVVALPAAGTATDAITTYSQYSDSLMYARWITTVFDPEVHQEGFYSERLQARQWMDWALLNNYRGASVGNFEFASTLAFAFGGGVGWRRGIGPSPSMVTWLSEDLLILRPQIVEACAYKTISIIGLNQIGINNQLAQYGAYFRDMSERVLTATTGEIDLNDDGIGEIFISLGSTNTLFT